MFYSHPDICIIGQNNYEVSQKDVNKLIGIKRKQKTEPNKMQADAHLTNKKPITPVWMSYQIHHKMLDEITCLSPKFNAVVEAWEWIGNISFHILLGKWLPIHTDFKVKPC